MNEWTVVGISDVEWLGVDMVDINLMPLVNNREPINIRNYASRTRLCL